MATPPLMVVGDFALRAIVAYALRGGSKGAARPRNNKKRRVGGVFLCWVT